MPSAIEACNVLIRFILNRITNSSNVDTKQYLYPIKALCMGKSQIGNFELVGIQALLKNAKQPEHSKTNVTGSEKDSPKTELKRSRSDLSTVILQQLTTPLGPGKITWAPLSNEASDCSVIYLLNFFTSIFLKKCQFLFLFYLSAHVYKRQHQHTSSK